MKCSHCGSQTWWFRVLRPILDNITCLGNPLQTATCQCSPQSRGRHPPTLTAESGYRGRTRCASGRTAHTVCQYQKDGRMKVCFERDSFTEAVKCWPVVMFQGLPLNTDQEPGGPAGLSLLVSPRVSSSGGMRSGPQKRGYMALGGLC